METVISLERVWAGYPKTPVLEDINLQVQALDFIGLIGPNGGGKTTLLKVLLGLVQPQRGTVKILERPVTQGRRYIGYVPQILELDRDFPIQVRDVVNMGRLGKRKLFHRYNRKDREIVQRSLVQVGMADKGDRPIGELSGGERQRVYIARALASEPKILLLDEPTANVDSQVQNSIYELLKELNQSMTIMMISHDLGAISTYVKTVGCLNRRLHYHHDRLITPTMIEETYQCPVDLIAHGIPHRVFPDHGDGSPTSTHHHSSSCDHA
ncbi:metal ABC transporter ATP-binding protein [Picosynechococcus sp. PCC 8807]|uniref:metal ABC transporter ATP-binding protein n=1 Tax=Picosynechococcus sp. PCC 8807 TaxID=195248 RepID=UPI0008108B22|nr:metal ABC transporter ATP-binding protein [Picosynechococcus sp. PCC 8807]ANV91431.1 ABC transporter [Picosynechococcus sp. PCC 8807]